MTVAIALIAIISGIAMLFLVARILAWGRRQLSEEEPGGSIPARTVPRCPVCGALSPYGLCPNGHAGTTWVDEPV